MSSAMEWLNEVMEHGRGRLPTLTNPQVVMNSLKYLSYVGKFAGLVTALDGIPFVDHSVGVIVFAAASLLKDTANRIGDLLDDGKPNKSFRG